MRRQKKKQANKPQDKLFIVQKYVMAPNANAAIRKSAKQDVDECYVDGDWKRGNAQPLAEAIGFRHDSDEE